MNRYLLSTSGGENSFNVTVIDSVTGEAVFQELRIPDRAGFIRAVSYAHARFFTHA